MPDGISYQQVQQAVSRSARVISDPPPMMGFLDLVRYYVAELETSPRPTPITLRSGPRPSAACMYAGLKAVSAEGFIAAAEALKRQRAFQLVSEIEGMGTLVDGVVGALPMRGQTD